MTRLALFGAQPELNEPLQPYYGLGDEQAKAALRVINSGCLSGYLGSPGDKFYGGPEVRQLENAWCEQFQVAHSISVNSATSGLIAAMGAIGINPGDEVIVPPYTMSATVVAPLFYGGIPVFVDIEDEHFCLNYSLVENAITSKTKAIIAVNLYGHPAELTKLRALADKHNIYLIEDNAQAILAQENGKFTGSIGHIGVFSLNVHKHLNVGEGGIVTTNDDHLAKRLQLIRNHGENASEWMQMSDLSNLIGYNFRLSEIHAAIAHSQLKLLDSFTERVIQIGETLSSSLKALDGITTPKVREGCTHAYFMWSCCFDEKVIGVSRDQFCKALIAEGFPIAQGYVRPLYKLPVFKKRIAIGYEGFPFTLSAREYPDGLCKIAEDLHYNRLFQFQPVSWNVSPSQLASLISAFKKVYEELPSSIHSHQKSCEILT